MLYKNVWKTLAGKWMQLLAIAVIIVMSSLTYTMMFYGISGIEVPTEDYLASSNQENFAVEMLNRVTEEEAALPELADFIASGRFTLSDLQRVDEAAFDDLIAARIDAVEDEMDGATLELRASKLINYPFGSSEHRGLVLKEADTINVSYLEAGKRPERDDEVAINTKYAEKNEIEVGDTIDLGSPFTVSGFVLFPDYTLPLFDENFFNLDPGTQTLLLMTDAAYDEVVGTESFRLAGITDGTVVTDVELPFVISIMETENIMRSGAIYSEISSGKAMALGLSLFIVSIAVIIVAILISNMLEAERGQIGLLKAIGYNRRQIALPYLVFILLFATLMLIIGYFLGLYFAEPLKNLYLDFYLLPSITIAQSPLVFLTAVFAPLLFFALVAGAVIYKIMGESALALLSPRDNVSLNRLSRIVSRLLRNARGKTKFKYLYAVKSTGSFIIFFFGILFSTLLIVFALMMNGAVDRMTVGELNEADYEYEAYTTTQPALRDGQEPFLTYPFAFVEDKLVTLKGLDETNTLYRLTNADGDDLTPASDEIIVNASLALKLSLEVGDTIDIELDNETLSYRIRGIADEYAGDVVYLPRVTLSEQLSDGTTRDLFNGIYATERPDETDYPTVISRSGLIEQSQSINEYMNLMMNVMIGGSALIAFSILFVLTALTVEKNYYVISLLKVMGYDRREVRSMILNSYFMYALVSALLSIPIALIILRVIIVVFAEDYGLVLPLEFEWVYVLYTLGAVTLLFFASTFISRRKIDQIPLQEVLKTYQE
ncbi:ABC transporter permease [Exiguobacterium aurantiacum]|uniref:FtsX-like permease family protein n=1 Tax=Exiguobacterium aurantiacum TaxID=33987 RepID=A0ABY5FRE6_9BACL|nr:FtsX-like permease family protein [Exiguobacterium aurantiacum]UTT43683.1 FtsX-like permease family protein [Exiguobacterium aurantiacum]